MGYDASLSGFHRKFDIPHGCCYGCSLTTKVSIYTIYYNVSNQKIQHWGDHSSEVGRKCIDNGIVDRLLYVYWNMKDPPVDIPGLEMATTLANYIIWLRSPYRPDGPGRWPNSAQVCYNYFVLIVFLAQHYGWST